MLFHINFNILSNSYCFDGIEFCDDNALLNVFLINYSYIIV